MEKDPNLCKHYPAPFDFECRDEWGQPLLEVNAHKMRVLSHPEDRLDAVIRLIDHAQTSIRAYYYMIANDAVGEQFANALKRASARGVKVTLGSDNFGSNETPMAWFEELREHGINYFCFSSRRSLRYLIRNHQKMLIIDDGIALIGGFNIKASYFDYHDIRRWEDLGLLLQGPKATELADYYDEFRSIAEDGTVRLREVRRLIRRWLGDTGPLQWTFGGPLVRLSPWALKLKKDLQRAKRADVVTAYFSPGRGLTRRFVQIVKRGGGLRLILAGKSDNSTTINASRLLYNYFVKRGSVVYEFQPHCLHTKLLVIDDIVYIGSANLDPRSLFINMELMLRIESAELASLMRKRVDALSDESEQQTTSMIMARRNAFTLLRQIFSYFLVVTIDYSVSRQISLWGRTKQLVKRRKND